MPTPITSPNNQTIKDTIKLEKRAERERQRRTVVEGVREVTRALAAGIIPVQAFVCLELITGPELQQAIATLERLEHNCQTHVFSVTPDVFGKLAMREGSGGVVLVVLYLRTDLEHFDLPENPLLVVVENVEKPGNLGAILRTADAAGVDAIVVCGDGASTDVHNPNVVRASLGTIFATPLAQVPTPQAIDWLKTRNIRVVAATPEGATLYTATNLRGPLAVVLGSEAHGLTPAWLAAADERVYIPMHGQADSLNLSASTAILLYEALRQRQP